MTRALRILLSKKSVRVARVVSRNFCEGKGGERNKTAPISECPRFVLDVLSMLWVANVRLRECVKVSSERSEKAENHP